MTNEQVPTSTRVLAPPRQLHPLQAWLERIGLSGKLLAIGGLVGVIAVFLPLLSMSMQLPTLSGNLFAKAGVNLSGLSTSHSVLVVQDLRGILCLVGYVAAIALAFVLYPPNGLGQKTLGWAGLGVGAVITVFAFWLLVAAMGGSGALLGLKVSVGMGAILNLLAGATVTAGGFLKARGEQLI